MSEGGDARGRGRRTSPDDGFEGVERTKMDCKVCVPCLADTDVLELISRVLDVRCADKHRRELERDAAWGTNRVRGNFVDGSARGRTGFRVFPVVPRTLWESVDDRERTVLGQHCRLVLIVSVLRNPARQILFDS
jgi:hypothetical protein